MICVGIGVKDLRTANDVFVGDSPFAKENSGSVVNHQESNKETPMKTIGLPHGYETRVDDDDYERLIGKRWLCCDFHGLPYVVANCDGELVRMHREILGCVKGDGKIVDHIDGNTLNNTKSNLRIATNSVNIQNQRNRSKKNRTGFIGVTPHLHGKWKQGGKWRAEIGYRMHRIFLGFFDSPEKAGEAYDRAAIFYFGENARTNFGVENAVAGASPQVIVFKTVLPGGLSAENLQNEFDDFLESKGYKQSVVQPG